MIADNEISTDFPLDPRVRRAIELMQSRLGEKLTVESLSRKVGLGRFHFLRIFRACTGETPYAYLTQLRLERAKKLILAGYPLTEVALRVGFYDQSHLNRHFRKSFGESPARYRAYYLAPSHA